MYDTKISYRLADYQNESARQDQTLKTVTKTAIFGLETTLVGLVLVKACTFYASKRLQ